MESSWLGRQPFWIWIALFLTGLNALLLNEFHPFLPGAESDLAAFTGWAGNPFWLRLPGVLFLLGGLGAGYWLGRRFFGKETMQFVLLVAAGSLLLPNASKWATADSWLWVFLLLASLGMLGHLKQAGLYWKWLTWLSWLAAIALQPLTSLIGLLAVFLVWRFRHPEGRRLDGLWLPLIGPVAFLLAWWWKGEVVGAYFLLDPFRYEQALAQLVGILPWLGFAVAGLIELVRHFSKREELATLLGGLLLGAIFSQSLWLQWVLALLVAKQLQRFVATGYPYSGWIRGIVLFQLVVIMVGGILGMMYGYYELGGRGFRMGMSLMLSYWVPAFFGAVGMLGRNQRLATLGFLFSGLLLSLAFWTQAAPELLKGWLY